MGLKLSERVMTALLQLLLLPAAAVSATPRHQSDDPFAVTSDGGYQSLVSSTVNRWVATSLNGSVSVPAVVPGQIQLDLRRAGVIEDTYKRFDMVGTAGKIYLRKWLL